MPLSRAQIPLTNPLALPDGGSIDTSNVGGSINTSNYGGSIDLSGDAAQPNFGGSITATAVENQDAGSLDMSANSGGSGGSINTSGGNAGNGGSINTSNYGGSISLQGDPTGFSGGNITAIGADGANAGSLNMSAGSEGSGGSIDTSDGGGSINTKGVGSIELGNPDTRTTLNGSATADRTITLPNATGTLPIALISASTALDFGSIGGNGDFADLTITLSGAVTTDVVFVTCISGGRGATDGKLIFEAFVSATDTVTVRAHNPHNNAINPASYNFNVAIIRTA